jgi:capsular exopolysaccharide synthesis family protein
MGRVDEAMRRAAEARGDVPAPETPGVDVEAFPAESPERPKLRGITPSGPVTPVATPKPAALLPSLATRLTAGLSRKVVIDQDIDPVSKEQYRRLATTLYATQAANGLKVVMVASALASEGKSLTASNLALTFSESYQKSVLLIDADLRRPSLHQVFGLQASPGLTDGLGANDDRKLALHHVSPTLTVLTAGVPTSDPMALLASDRMRRLVDEARETFEWVVIDTPPLGILADANLLAELADGAVLVVRAESTPYDIVQRTAAMLGRDRLLGVVLNRARQTPTKKYQYSSYYTQPTASR